MKRNLIASLLFACAVNYIAVIALFGLVAAPAQGGSCSASPCHIPNLFDPDLAELKPTNNAELADVVKAAQDAIKGSGNNQEDRSCYPKAITLTLFDKPIADDPKLNDLLVKARMDAIIQYLNGNGVPGDYIDSSSAPPTTRTPGEPGSDGTADVAITLDRDPPVLKTNSTPPKGTKVKQGDQIKIHATASERHDDGHKSWPSGVKSIQLIANGILQEQKDFGMKPPPCKVQPFEPIYTVPKNPPPIVHLRIYTEDATGHGTFEEADFPTEDWYGTLREHAQGNIYNDTVYVHFSFNEQGDDTIKGKGRVDKMTSEPVQFVNHTITRTLHIKPAEAEFPISGKRVGDEFQLELQVPKGQRLSVDITSDNGTTEGSRSVFVSEPSYHPKVKAQDGATNSFHTNLGGKFQVDATIEIHRAKQ